MKVLVTGANGFLGSHIVEKSVQKGYETFGAIRPGADTSLLDEINGFRLLDIDYSSSSAIYDSVDGYAPYDIIVHSAGLTKSFTPEGYQKVNVGLTAKLSKAVKEHQLLTPQGTFVYISSMAARGPVGNLGPASKYGESKLQAEEVVKDSGISYMIFRPTGIYGARDIQFLPLMKSVKMGLYPQMTASNHKMTLISGRDVAENVLKYAYNYHDKIIHLDDGQVYEHDDLKKTIESVLGKKSIKLVLPRPVVLSILFLTDIIDKMTRRMPKVSVEQYREISQDWNYDFSEERQEFPLIIKDSLNSGFEHAIAYYREKNLI